ncbi:HEPN domain-containing protein [Pyrobaculum aerophilum]|uniref:HEPN domain-containing protein n=1 Tax=Pyrobaculum aerophilum TaxID=13773 RepID=UPI002161C7F9|nr:HEPN domain-containing protein [Pyrobaculum aerophilum]
MRREAVFWIREAWADLCSAKVLYGARRWNASAFYGHQAVEKALKSLYFVASAESPPRPTSSRSCIERLNARD